MLGKVLSLLDDVKRGYDLANAGIRAHVIRDLAEAIARRDWPKVATIAIAQMPRPYFDGEHGAMSADAIGIPEAALAMATDSQLRVMVTELKSSKACHRFDAFDAVASLHSLITTRFLETFSKEARISAGNYVKNLHFAPKDAVTGDANMSEEGQAALDAELQRWGSDGGK